MTSSSQVSPYGSARDLPSVTEMEQQMAAFRLLGFLLPKDQRKQLKELQHEHRRITEIVDTLYALLGEQNWVFTGDLNLPAIEHVIDSKDPTAVEALLIDYYKTADRISLPLRRLHRFEAMRLRIDLLHKALTDYEAGRYYSTVMVLLSVMDGFVNDLDTATRQGLHARQMEDIVAWNSVAGHLEPTPTLRESLNRWQDIQNQKARIEEWHPHEYEPDLTAEEPSALPRVCADFLTRWQKRQWAPVGAHFMELGSTRSSVGRLAVEAKDLYRAHELSSWTILRVRHVAAAVAHTDVEIVVNGAIYRTGLRWVHIDDAGSTATEWEPGRWALSMYWPSHFLKREAIIEESESSGAPTH